MKALIPSVFATTGKDYVERFNQAASLSKRVHVDVMDGRFVAKKSPALIFLMNRGKEIDAHLMAQEPVKYIPDLKRLKVRRVFMHLEIHNLIDNLLAFKEFGFKTGLAISPQTKIDKVKPYVQFADCFLVMGVKPGKEGQRFIASTPVRVKELSKISGKKEILVDGGINAATISRLGGAGAVVGSDVSAALDPKKEFLALRRKLR